MPDLTKEGLPIFKSKSSDFTDDGLPILKKKEATTPDLTSGTQTSKRGFEPFQTPVDTKTPSVLTPKGKTEYQEQVKAFKPLPIPKEGEPKPKKADGGGATAFMAGLNTFNQGVFKTPRIIYDAASTVTDAALQALNIQQDETNYDDVVAASGYTSPLSVLDRLGDYYGGKANQYEQRQEKFDKDIINSFLSGDIKDGGKQLWNNIAGSVPSMIGMALTGGAGNIAKLKYAQKTLASALPFISGRNAELSEDESIPKPVRVVNSVLNGYSEVIFDQSFGATAMLQKVIGNVFQNQGRDAAIKVAKDFTKGFATEAIKKIQPLTGVVKGAVEEMSTTLSQNIVDKYTIDPERDLMEGVLDAGLVGGVMTGGIGAIGTVAYSSSQKKKVADLMKKREELVNDLDNDNLPDEVKSDLSDNLSKIDNQISKIDDDNEAVVSKLSDEDKAIVQEKEVTINAIEQALQDETISETTKNTLADKLLKEQDAVDEILTKPLPPLEKPTIDTEEQIIAEGQQAEVTVSEIEKPKSIRLNMSEEGLAKMEGKEQKDVYPTRQFFENKPNNVGLPEPDSPQFDPFMSENKDNTKEETVDLSEITPTQELVDKSGIGGKLTIGNPKLVRFNDGLFVLDGHHRISTEAVKGNTKIKADVTTIDMTSAEWSEQKINKFLNEQENAVNQGNIEQSNITEREGVTEQQQGKQKDRLNQEKSISEAETETSNRGGVVESREVEEVKPIKQLGTGANVYYETDKYRVNDLDKGEVVLNIQNQTDLVPIANIKFDNASDAVKIAEALNKYYPKGVPDAVLINKVVDGLKKELLQPTQEEFTNEEDYTLNQVEKTNDPEELASLYYQQESAEPDYKTEGIMDYLGTRTRINLRDWKRYNDENNLTPAIRRRYIDSTNKSGDLDANAMELSEQLGIEITPDDFANVILDFGSTKEYKAQSKTKVQKAISDKYYELTGKKLTEGRAERAYFKIQNKPKTDKELYELNESLQEIGITYEDIERYNEYAKQEFEGVEKPIRKTESDTGTSIQLRKEGERVQEVDALKDVEATAKALEDVAIISPQKIIQAAKAIDKIEYVQEQEARDIIESYTHYKSGNQKSPATRWAGWFQSVNAANKKFIVDDIQNDPKLRNAMLSLFYDVYKAEFNFKGTFDDFLNTEITLYRGITLADKKGVGQEGFSAFSTTKNRVMPYADEQALGKGQVKEIKIKPKDTYGAVNYIGGGEVEVLVPTDFKKETLKDDFNRLVELNIGLFNEDQLNYIEKLYDKEDYISGIAFAKSVISSNPKKISEAYHKAKKDGTNTELVKAVEELLGKKSDERKTEEVKRPIETPRVAERKGEVESAKQKLEEAKAKLNEFKNKFGIFKDPKEEAKVNFEYHKALVGVAKAYIKEGIDNVKDFAKEIGEKVSDAIENAWIEASGGKELKIDDFMPTKASDEKESEGGSGKRMTTQRVLSGTYRKAFKDAMTENAIYYKELPNDLTSEEAQAIIDIKGQAEAEALVFDMNNNLSLPVRFSITQKLIDNYERSGETLKAVDIFERIVEKITDTAQGLQSLSTWPKLSKASQVAMAKKTVETQRNKAKKRVEKTTNKIDKEFKKANKEAAEETVKVVKKAIEANTKLGQEGSISDLPLGYGTKNKVFTRDRYLKAKKMLRGMAMSGATPEYIIDIAGYHIEATGRDFARFARRMKADLGSKIKPFIKDIYGQARESLIESGYDESLFLTDEEIDVQLQEQEGQVWKDKLEKAIDKKDEKAQKVAIKKLQEISKEEGVWGQYKESAAKKLKGMVITNIEKDISGNPSLQQFTDGLVKNMRQKMAELLPEKTTTKPVPRPDIEIIGDAYKNVEAYKEVWEKTQQEFQEKYADQPEVLEAIDEYFGEILDKPFSDRLIEGAVKKGLKDLGANIADLVVQHYTVIDNVSQTLADKLVNEAGLTGTEANSLAKAIQKEFDRIATKKKEAILNKIFSKNERKKPAVKTLESEIIKLTNLGAFRSDAIIEAYADKMGFPKLKEENIKEIERLSDIVQNTDDPIKKRRAVEDLLAYQARIKGISITELVTSIWYANVLSGYNTQVVNFGANAINTALLYANAVAQRPKDAKFIAKGLILGIKRGWLEAEETFKTGYSPIKGKAEMPQVLEREDFGNYEVGGVKLGLFGKYINNLKYVRRVMIAADVIFFEGQKEMRAYQMAMIEASKELKDRPSKEQLNRAIEIVGRSDGQIAAIKEQVEIENQNAIAEINNSTATQAEKKKLIEQTNRDKQRRIFDLIEQQRGADMIRETAEYAAEGTYNYQPKGALGAFASAINTMVQYVPAFRLVVPFTNIIANVANETINYTPLAFTRLKTGGYTKFRREVLSDQQRADLITKGAIGTTLMAAVFILSQAVGDDDEPFLEITANGTGDFSKNATLQETGWQSYSIRFKLPNGEYSGWISYQYTPLIASLGFIGHINDLKKYKDVDNEETMVTLMSKSAGLTINTFFQATFLEGLNDFLASLFDPRSSQTLVEQSIKSSAQIAKGVVLPNMISQINKGLESTFGEYKKETRDNTSILDNMLGIMVQDMPVARDILFDKINILGDQILSDTDKFYSSNKANKYIQLLVDKKAVFAPINRKAEKIYDIELGRERVLTDEEFFEYSKDKGQYIKQALELNYDKYKSMSQNEFNKELNGIKKEATESARYAIADIGTELIDVVKIVNGESKTFRMNAEQVKLAKELIDTRMNDKSMDAFKKSQIESYMKVGKLSRKDAEKKTEMQLNKSATKYAKNTIWLKHIEGKDPKYKLELK